MYKEKKKKLPRNSETFSLVFCYEKKKQKRQHRALFFPVRNTERFKLQVNYCCFLLSSLLLLGLHSEDHIQYVVVPLIKYVHA